jgi:hypothetical protein
MLSLGGAVGSMESLLFDVGLTARLAGLFSTPSWGLVFATGVGSVGEVLEAEERDWVVVDVSEDVCESCCGFSSPFAVSLTGLVLLCL